jgi:DNA-binding NtrC family response regulator
MANAIEHAVILSDSEQILPEHLPSSVGGKTTNSSGKPFLVANFPRSLTLREIEEEVIVQTMEKYDGDKPSAAKELGIALKTLYNKLNQYATGESAEAG